MQTKRLVALICLCVLTVAAIALAVRMAVRVPAVLEEARTTPTPTPVYGNVMQVTPDPNAPTAAPVLRTGTFGDPVVQLQTRLQALGYYEGKVDGQFGNGTANAVKRFQQQHGLDSDGVVGPETSAMLYSNEARRYITPTPQPTATPTVKPTAVPTATPAPTEEPTARPAAVDVKPYLRADGLPMLVNKSYPLPEDYKPYQLTKMNDYCDPAVVKIKYADTYAEREAIDGLLVMLRAAQAEGVSNWQISAAFRDVAYQKRLFDQQVREHEKNGLSHSKAVSATRRTVADPGTSEHHLGTAFDITVPGKTFAGTTQAEWLAQHCWDYGFILRYTKDKEAITGFVAEAWHFRYVGVEHSRPMHEQNLCLEEYIDLYGLFIEDW